VTRIDSVRHAADVTKDSVRHAAEVAAPYANTARLEAARYGRQAGRYGKEYGRQARLAARHQYEARLAERVMQAREQARAAVPPKAATTAELAARQARLAAAAAARYTAPRVGQAVTVTRTVAGPAREEAMLRGAAALHALRGDVSAADIQRLVRRRVRRERTGRVLRGLVVAGLAGGAVFSAWKWWTKQTSPDWLVEPADATEVDERTTTLTVVDPLEDDMGGPGSRIDQVDGSPEAAGVEPQDAGSPDSPDSPESEAESERRKGEGREE
jgi:hypothetical protein